MFRAGPVWVVSPADLVDVVECPHRSVLHQARAAHQEGAPTPQIVDPLAGEAREELVEAELRRLRALFGGDAVATVAPPRPVLDEVHVAAQATREAIRDRVPVIHHGVVVAPIQPGVLLFGQVDFLIATTVDPETGACREGVPAGYEPWQAVGHATPRTIVELAACATMLADTLPQAPEFLHVRSENGHHALRVSDYVPLVGVAQDRLIRRLAAPPELPSPVWGEPCPACETCGFATWCAQGRARDRHVSLVAGIRGDQIVKLQAAGITTIDALARAGEEQRPPLLARRTYTRLREQAALQVRQDATRTADNPTGRVFATVYAEDGLVLLPAPSAGDVVFTVATTPVGDDGELAFLWGAYLPSEERHCVWWAHDRAEERVAFAAFVDFVSGQLRADGEAHLYCYTPQGASRLAAFAASLGVREAEVDDLLRQRRCVDLSDVVKKSVRVSQRSYALSALEPLYLGDDAQRWGGGEPQPDGYAAYRRACRAGDSRQAQAVQEALAAQVRRECVSVARLRDWLEKLRVDHGIVARPAPPETVGVDPGQQEQAAARRAAVEERIRSLTEALAGPAAGEGRGEDQDAWDVLSALLGYYRREEAPLWWDFFRRLSAPVEELEADADCVVPLWVRAHAWVPPQGRQRKAARHVEVGADPRRLHPFGVGDQVRLLYPGVAGQGAEAVPATVVEAAADRLVVVEKADVGAEHDRQPLAVLPGAPVRSTPKDEALWEVAERVAAALPRPPQMAGVDLLRRVPPRLRGGGALPDPGDFGGDTVAAVLAAVDALDDSYLAVQGPPGAGKTYLAARLITHLVGRGLRVGVCATSHQAIENVLRAAVRAAAEAGVGVPCAKRPSGVSPDRRVPWEQPRQVRDLVQWCHRQEGGYLVGGTAWNFTHPQMRGLGVDVLLIDEAGQFALADAVAVSAAARSLVLLGDPQQLPHVVQGVHAAGADRSALEHVVGDADIIDPAYGYFLAHTRRMHPGVCTVVSHLAYQGRLSAHPDAALRGLAGVEAGVYRKVVAHQGRSTHSPEEVRAVVEVVAQLVGREWCEPGRPPRPLQGSDIMVVAPFNVQVRALRAALAEAGLEAVRVGTVDRFQGQEAPVVVCSMTVSSAREAPRGMEFVLSRNRLTVALSRAQAVAVVVCAPSLVESAARTMAELRALAGFAHVWAQARDWPDPAPG